MRDPRPRWRLLIAAVACCAAGAATLALDGPEAAAVLAFAGASWTLMVFLVQRRTISLLATLTVAGAAVALLMVDEPPRRFGFGVAVTACAALCAGVWWVGWRRDGGRLTLLRRLGTWLRTHWLSLLIVVAASSIAGAAALHAPAAVVAVLVGLLHALLLARLRHPRATLIAGAIAAAIVVALLAYVPSLPIALLIAVAVWFGYLFIFVRGLSDDERSPADVREGLMQFSGRILVSALLLVGALVGLGLAVGAILGRRTTPLHFEYVQFGVGGLAILIALVVCWWWRSYVSIVQREDGGYLVGLLLGLVVVGLLFVALDKPSRSDDRSEEDKRAARDAVNGRFDLLLVVDPADPVGRMLIRRAQRDVRPASAPDGSRAGVMFVSRHLDSTYDVAYGIAVPERHNGRRALWRLVEPPTTDVPELELSLASLSPRRRPATGSYGRLLSDVGSEWRVGWRPGARRGIAFLLDRLPTPPSLGVPGRAARRSCDALIAEQNPGRRRIADRPAVARPWPDALAEHCLQRELFRLWHNAGRLARDRTAPPWRCTWPRASRASRR